MSTKKLNVYVWTDVLQDYGIGIAFALATSEDKARIEVELAGCDPNSIKDIKPIIVTTEQGFYNCGFNCAGS